jgi:hypothetical protein
MPSSTCNPCYLLQTVLWGVTHGLACLICATHLPARPANAIYVQFWTWQSITIPLCSAILQVVCDSWYQSPPAVGGCNHPSPHRPQPSPATAFSGSLAKVVQICTDFCIQDQQWRSSPCSSSKSCQRGPPHQHCQPLYSSNSSSSSIRIAMQAAYLAQLQQLSTASAPRFTSTGPLTSFPSSR